MIAFGLRHFVAIAAAAAIIAFAIIYTAGLAPVPIRADGFSYYAYLPSWLIYGDATLEALARECCGGVFPAFTAINRWPSTGRFVNAHPTGVALLLLPFFALAHLLTLWANLPDDGFSVFYQYGAGLAGVFYLVAGLYLLQRVLESHFPSGVVLATLVSITWGTNLFHYGTFDSVYSHVFSFFLFCALLYLTPRWLGPERSLLKSVPLGAVAGLIVLVRHANVCLLLFVFLYGVTNPRALAERFAFLRARRLDLFIVCATALLLVLPQLALYRWATGRWIVSAYGRDWFDFASPQLLPVLFGTQKGLFFWSPILALAVAGFFVGHPLARALLLPSLVYFPITLYLVSTWWDWQLGGSYGHRGFTDALPALAIPLAAFYQTLAWQPGSGTARASRHKGALVSGVAALLVALSIFQMIQYWLGAIPMSGTTWEQYRAVFLKLRP